ncbi:MAG: hypothetical protein ACPGO5_00060 [Patescibacteria group bacterium]
MKTVITAGAKGADIDVLACVVAYAELLELEGHESVPVVAGEFTMSVTPKILGWGAEYTSTYTPDGTERFVLVDISDPDQFPSFVDVTRVDEVYDHRAGHEKYWEEKLGVNSHVEMVGACGTLVWEEFKKRGKSQDISSPSAKLLLASIVSNTLNFKAPLTTDRDKVAYSELSKLTGLNDDWIAEYFSDQEAILMQDFKKYLGVDTKVFKVGSDDFVIGQLELWDADKLLSEKSNLIDDVMKDYDHIPWIVNILNISKGHNYIYSKSESGKKTIAKTLNVTFDDNIAKTKELLLRKYIMKELRS